MLFRAGIVVSLAVPVWVSAAPSYVQTPAAPPADSMLADDQPLITGGRHALEPDKLTRPLENTWPGDVQPVWATRTGWTDPGVSPNLSRLGIAETLPSEALSTMADSPAAVPLPGAFVGGLATLMLVAIAYGLRRRQSST